ncbi:hypothetical protein LEL_08263 [Akanthomyces lecanii RCEF 1005]|uniref:Px domain containing protein n=1 Tax=Akanthomyces lecanii RCEF 1005 TaxID=1081108 RepID=A0A162JWJ7_CORDF|nr:hypothetical protein LEL_08263 [Akanthomyces lecanii RCEF 1005]
MSQSQLLTPEQTHALFDILTHHETYSEIEAFKSADAVLTHGFPFRDEQQQARAAQKSDIAAPAPTSGGGGLTGFALSLWGRSGSSGATPTPSAPDSPRVYTPSMAESSLESDGSDAEGDEEDLSKLSALPVMQLLTSTFVMRLPALKMMPRDFWAVRVQGLLSRFADADLSESYDKGTMGARKTLASGSGSVIEMISRGFLGGVGKKTDEAQGAKPTTEELKKKTYNLQDGQQLVRAWEDVLDGLVYGDLVDDMFDYLAETDKLEEHSAAVDASSSYIVFHLAALLHQIFALSPDGQYLLKLLDNIHGLIPYKMIKQTLHIGNAATMINGMMRLLLAKLSVTGLTNWLGVTQNEDDGMNLLQNIISLVLSRDASEFKKIIHRIDKMQAKDAPTEEMLEAIQACATSSKAEHEALRKMSLEAKESIIVSMLKARDPTLVSQLSEAQHALCLEYYSALLSIRDRDAITKVLCRQPPDLFTKALKEATAAYNPMIRVVHERIDLGDHLQDLQEFISQFVRVTTPKGGQGGTVTVEDYVKLLNDHKPLLHKFVHVVAKKCPEVWRDFREWSNASIVRFRQETVDTTSEEDGKKRSVMEEALGGLVAGLDDAARKSVLAAVDTHASYLATLKKGSDARLAQLAARTGMDSEAPAGDGDGSWGPGIYLARWQDILDDTLITAGDAGQPTKVRRGADVRHLTTQGKTGVAGGDLAAGQAAEAGQRTMPRAPDVEVVVKELGEAFSALMQAVNMERRVFGKK